MTIALRPDDLPLTLSPLHDRAESREGKRLAGVWEQLAEARSSTALTEQALSELDAVAAEALTPNWDGYGGLPVSRSVYRQARRLLQALPSSVAPPDIGITPGGEVALEWHAGSQWAFSMVLGSDQTLTYAGLFGSARLHGREAFVDEISRPVMAALYRYLAADGQR